MSDWNLYQLWFKMLRLLHWLLRGWLLQNLLSKCVTNNNKYSNAIVAFMSASIRLHRQRVEAIQREMLWSLSIRNGCRRLSMRSGRMCFSLHLWRWWSVFGVFGRSNWRYLLYYYKRGPTKWEIMRYKKWMLNRWILCVWKLSVLSNVSNWHNNLKLRVYFPLDA